MKINYELKRHLDPLLVIFPCWESFAVTADGVEDPVVLGLHVDVDEFVRFVTQIFGVDVWKKLDLWPML